MPVLKMSSALKLPNKGWRTRWPILAFLATEGPLNGSQLRTLIHERLRFFWNESFGQIYPTLQQLHREGLIGIKDQQRSKTVWFITKAGRQALKEWCRIPPKKEHIRWELLLRVMFGSVGNLDSLKQHLQEFLTQVNDELTTLESYLRVVTKLPATPEHQFIMLTLDCGMKTYQTWLEWGQRALTHLNKFSKEF